MSHGLFVLAAIVVVSGYISYGRHLTSITVQRNSDRLRRRLHKRVTVEWTEGKLAMRVTGVVQAVKAKELELHAADRVYAIPLSGIRNISAGSGHQR